MKEASINVVPGNPSFNGAVTYTGTADSHFDIISVALKYRWDESGAGRQAGLLQSEVSATIRIREKAGGDAGLFRVRPAWASTWRWKSSRELVIASEANRRASFREAGVKEAGSEAAGRRTGTG